MYLTEAVVLKKAESGEANALITFYSKEYGKIRALAQGVKKQEAKLKGHVEPLNQIIAGFVPAKNGERLTQALMENFWSGIRNDFFKFSAACYIVALFDRHCMFGEKDLALWDLLQKSFLLLEEHPFSGLELKKFLMEVDKQFLSCLGYQGEDDIKALGNLVEKPLYLNYV